jgi:hypothetical protein
MVPPISSVTGHRGRSTSPGRRQRAAGTTNANTNSTNDQAEVDIVLLVGGTGKLGSIIAKHLVQSHKKTVKLLLGGRSFHKGTEKAKELNCEFVIIDAFAMDPDTIGQLLEQWGVDILVNAVGPFHDQKTTLLEAAVSVGCHYLDVCDDIHGFARRAKQFHQRAVQNGSICVTTAGVFPGLSNLVAASLIEEGNGAESVRLDYFMAGSCGFGTSVMISSMNGSITPSVVFKDGKQYEYTPFTGRRIVDFGPIVGKRPVYHFALPECFSIQEAYHVPNVRAMFGIAPDFFNRIMLLTGFVLKFMPRSWDETFANYAMITVKPFDWWLGKTFAMRIAVVGKDRVLRVHRQTHQNGFDATGDTVARQILAILQSEDCSPGVLFPEEVIKGESRTRIIEHSVAGASSSDILNASVTDSEIEDPSDLNFDEERPIPWFLQKIILAIPMTVVLSVIWEWELHWAFAALLLILLWLE